MNRANAHSGKRAANVGVPPISMRIIRLLGMLATLGIVAACGPASRMRSPVDVHVRSSHAPLTSESPRSDAQASASPGPCDPDRALDGFVADETPLRSIAASGPPVPTHTWNDDTIRFDLPEAWFPSRRHEGEAVLYRVLTGDPDDVVAIYIGREPAFTPINEGAFRLRQGQIAIRGGMTLHGTFRRLEAVAAVPCDGRPYISVWARTRSADRFASVIAMLRSIARAAAVPSTLREAPLVATRDRDALDRLAHGDAIATELVDRALAAGTLAARYPLATDHPLADQLLSGRFPLPVGSAPAEIEVTLPVRAGRIELPAPYRALHDATLTRAFGELVAAGCNATAVRLAIDDVALRCANGTDLRMQGPAAATATLWPDALGSAARFERSHTAWMSHADRVGGWPPTLCGRGPWVIDRVDTREIARSERCTLALDPSSGRVEAAAFTGACGDLPMEPWSTPFRQALHFDEIRGSGAGACTYMLGWNGRRSWALAVGDGGTASAPLASGPVVAVNRRAVHTAVAFVTDLERWVTGRTEEIPVNVRPSVLASLGAAHHGDPGAHALAERLRATGVTAGAGAAVLNARSVDAEHVAVEFLGLTVELTDTSEGWLVTSARFPEASTSAAPAAPARSGINSRRRSGH